jgi:hypothetical protein
MFTTTGRCIGAARTYGAPIPTWCGTAPAGKLINRAKKKAWDPNLRSTHDVDGHHIQASDGEIGHVEDFIVDDKAWTIRYLIIDTRNVWPGKKVLVSPEWIERISWQDSKIVVNLTRRAVQESPEYAEEAPPTREYEAELHRHYNLPGYWIEEQADKKNPK